MIKYHDPIGKTIMNPELEFIMKLLSKDASYWLSGSGESSLEFADNKSSLIFFKEKKYGVFIMQLPDYLSPYKTDENIEIVHHDISGVPFQTPSNCYFSVKEALKMLTSFVENKSITNIGNWKNIYKIIDESGCECDDEY